MIPVPEALRIVLERTPVLPPEEVALGAAAGRVLRETVHADRDFPPFDRAAVDGYAVRAADVAERPAVLRVVGLSRAGRWPRFRVGPNQAAALMTGAPVPPGADAALMVEDTVEADGLVRFPRPGRPAPPVAAGSRITARGAEVAAGTPLLAPGQRLSAAGAGLLASVGRVRVAVGPRPSAAVLSTGDELASPGKRVLRPAEIRDANGPLLLARCRALGLPVRRLGVARDDPERLGAALRRGLEADLFFLSGGVSAGRFDCVEDLLEQAGVRLLVTAVAIRPGKPFVFGVAGNPRRTLVFALPGNPASALTTFEVFAAPAIRRLEGLANPASPILRARLSAPLPAPGPRRAYLPARLFLSEDGASGASLEAAPIRSRGSGDISALALANGFVIRPEGGGPSRAGDPVPVQPLEDSPDPAAPDSGAGDAGAGWHDPRE